jgi:hypothetical protein
LVNRRFQNPVETKNRLVNAIKSRLDVLLQKKYKAIEKINDKAVIGSKVIHKKFGDGVIILKEGSNLNTKLKISFKNFGEKWLVVEKSDLKFIE